MAIYLPQQPTFMDQFLGTGVMNNVMQAMMMRMQNQRADKEYAQGLQEKGYTEIEQPDYTSEANQVGMFTPPPKPDVTIGGRRGLLGAPKREFKAPKETFGIEQGTGKKDWAVVRKGNKLVSASLIKTKAPKDQDKYGEVKTERVNNSVVYSQKNETTGKTEYFRVPPQKTGKNGTGSSPQPRAIKTWKTTSGKIINLPNNVKPPKGAVPYKDDRMVQKDIATVEEKIISNPKDKAVVPSINAFNRSADTPYYYKWKVTPGRFYGTNEGVEKVQLPVYNGHQLTLADIRQTAKEEGISWDESLRRAMALGNSR